VLGDPRRDLGPRGHFQLAPDVLHVRLRCPQRNRRTPGDGVIGQPFGDQIGDLELASGQ
jgi:hypothetical protein